MNTQHGAVALVALLAASVFLPGVVASAGADAGAAGDIAIDYEGDDVTVANGSSQVISGSADLSEGDAVEIQVRSTGDTQPQFYKTQTARVAENGSWAAAFDFSEQSPGGTFNVTVSAADGEASANATGEIVACDGECADPAPERGVTIDTSNGTVTVANGSTQVISGTASEPTGTEIFVTVQSTGDTQPRFYKTSSAVVTENGTWATAFNFTDSNATATFSVEAGTEGGEASATAEGEMVPCGDHCADTPPSDTPTPIPEQTATTTPSETDADDPTVALTESAVDTVRGDTATIELRFDGTDTAALTVGSERAGYVLDLVVRDADDDGTATVYFDTELAGREGDTVSVSSGDEVTVRSESSLSAALDAGDYELQVLPDGQDQAADVGTLFVSENEVTPTDGSTPTDAPAGNEDMTGMLVSAGILLGGGGLALVLLRG